MFIDYLVSLFTPIITNSIVKYLLLDHISLKYLVIYYPEVIKIIADYPRYYIDIDLMTVYCSNLLLIFSHLFASRSNYLNHSSFYYLRFLKSLYLTV